MIGKEHERTAYRVIESRFIELIGYRVKVLLVIQQQINLCALINDSRYFVVLRYFSNLEILFLFSYQFK